MSYGFSFNGRHSKDFGIIMRSTNRQLLPLINDQYIDVPGRSGSYLFPGEIQDREIQLDCAFMSKGLPDMRKIVHNIAVWLYTHDKAILSFDDEPGMYYRGKIASQIDFDHIATLGQFSLVFRCDPFAYGAEESLSFANDAAVIINHGTAETPPRFKAIFTAAADEWKVVNQDGYFIRIEHDFQEGDTLEVNCITGGIYVNDARKMDALDWQHSIFFPLRVDANTLEIMPKNICNTQVFWIPRYY